MESQFEFVEVEAKEEPLDEPIEEPVSKVALKVRQCKVCKNFFSNNSNLKKHVKRMHPNHNMYLKSLSLRNLPQTKLCDVCGKYFSRFANLKRHIQKLHEFAAGDQDIKLERNSNSKKPKTHQNQKCAWCDLSTDRKTMMEHYETEHDIDIVRDDLWFDTIEEFFDWKDAFELETNSLFIQAYNKMRDGKMYRGFQCHRSGTFLSNSKGQRRLKMKGSKKINGLCPAFIWLKKVNSQFCVHIVKTHVGHHNEIGHLNLKQSERESIAAKIAANIPFDAILEEFHNSVSKSNLKRSHLLTRKDLHNIRAKMVSTSSPKHSGKNEPSDIPDNSDNIEIISEDNIGYNSEDDIGHNSEDDIGNNSEDDMGNKYYDDNNSEDENHDVTKKITRTKGGSVEKKKEYVYKNLTELIKKVSGMDYNELVAVEKGISAIRPTILAVKSSKPVVERKIKFVRDKKIACPPRLVTIIPKAEDII